MTCRSFRIPKQPARRIVPWALAMSIAVGAAPAEANPPWTQTTEMQVRVQENFRLSFCRQSWGHATYLTARFVRAAGWV